MYVIEASGSSDKVGFRTSDGLATKAVDEAKERLGHQAGDPIVLTVPPKGIILHQAKHGKPKLKMWLLHVVKAPGTFPCV
jgi:hypothetical protein